jgi:hypothetical protein
MTESAGSYWDRPRLGRASAEDLELNRKLHPLGLSLPRPQIRQRLFFANRRDCLASYLSNC